ncbi:putative hydrolase or acyltransferase of alpha/beta superfamily [Beggiatoa alba B18LD]|uniref:Putative hydrolase or acyltransferase of alpha/beta superfamily n=1 Tax=Beggiatoa alba B18LD TaxID=395493 RepID=I3CEU4_9GAMM|nr:alpha/beta hydrolase [Beggiatoa alba]EIJ42137.1 putative hydrolase or acyltransferase of alpha/beta superfamily [Beggiatoa alba B18LD]
MELEVIKRLPKTPTQKPPIVFIHGAFIGAICWDVHFLPYFAKQGYPAYAVSLRGHGKSGGNLRSASIQDYVEDIASITLNLEEAPIIVGHSMGGMVAQRYMEQYPCQAVILMNSVSPNGINSSAFYMSLTDPLLFQQFGVLQSFGTHFINPVAMKRALFSPNMPDEKVEEYFTYMQNESHQAVLDLLNLEMPPHRPTNIPMLVLGAENDVFFPPAIVYWTASTHRADMKIFPKTAHGMMLELNWQSVADYILNWLDKQKLAK